MVNFSNKVLTHYYLKNTKFPDSKLKTTYENIKDFNENNNENKKLHDRRISIVNVFLFLVLIVIFPMYFQISYLNISLISIVFLMFLVQWDRIQIFDY